MPASWSIQSETLRRGEVGNTDQTFPESSPPLPVPHWGTRGQTAQLLLVSVSLSIPQEGAFWGGAMDAGSDAHLSFGGSWASVGTRGISETTSELPGIWKFLN